MKSRSQWNWMLWPSSVLYSSISRARIWAYRKKVFRTRRLPGVVISVGNLTVGGTGKTPMVIWLSELLHAEGMHVAILTRGYRGTKPEGGSGEVESDEVALFRTRLGGHAQLGVGANRFKNGQVLARHGVNCFILDDGFQHVKLARDVNILLLDATDPFGGGRVLPAGRLREPISALRRADVVVVTRANDMPSPAIEAMVRRFNQCPVFYARTKFEGLHSISDPESEVQHDGQNPQKYFAFCAIGNPTAYFADLRKWGFTVIGERSFPDHHVYSQKDFDDLSAQAAQLGTDALLCTEKDVWNLRNVAMKSIPVVCCRISMELPTSELRGVLSAALAARRAADGQSEAAQ